MRHADERTTDILGRLRSGDRTPSGLSVPTIATDTDTGFGPVRLALGENGEARLLMPLGSRERPPPPEQTEALRVGVVTYAVDGRPTPFLDLTCLEPRLEPLFAEIVDEMRRRISDGQTASEACRSTIEDYRTLLSAQSESDVSVETVAGLVAELILLERLLRLSPVAWVAWRGPLKDRHDFRAATTAIEVKAGLRRHSRRVRINSELADNCCQLADSRLDVRRLVSDAGCVDPEATEWNRYRFNNEETQTFEVTEQFPRIVPASFSDNIIPSGVLDVEYVIDLGHPAVSPLSSGEEDALIERFIACLKNA